MFEVKCDYCGYTTELIFDENSLKLNREFVCPICHMKWLIVSPKAGVPTQLFEGDETNKLVPKDIDNTLDAKRR